MLYRSKLHKKMNSSNNVLLVAVSAISGHLDANVISLAVIAPIYNHQMRMDGSGPVQELKLVQQLNATLVTGVQQADMANNSLITEKPLK